MRTLFWNLLARVLARPAVTEWLITRAKRTPYSHLPTNDDPSYMERYWLFNPYPTDGAIQLGKRYISWLPSVRLHHIKREDLNQHMHDHPWDARTIILYGWYYEVRMHAVHFRDAGDTAQLKFGEYHKIKQVCEGGVWTLFITWRYRGTWGFLVDGKKMPWRVYLGLGERK